LTVPKYFRVYNTRLMKRVLIILTALALSGAIVGVGAVFYLFNSPLSTDKTERVFEVKPGPLGGTAKRLQQEGFIRSDLEFKLFARISGYDGKVRVGEYLLASSMTPTQILEVISSGKSIQHALTIPEGANIFEISLQVEHAGIAKKEEFYKLCRDQNFLKKHLDFEVVSCEGFLFPETYAYTKYTTAETLMSEMIAMFVLKFKNVGELGAKFGLNKNQLVTLASIIEKETGVESERSLVSSVYHNRLRIKMRLQADPTTLYGKMVTLGSLQNNITREDLTTVNHYNTYAMSGLPIGPIANPGLAALQAAVNPATSEYLYFVSQNDGKHVFSKDFKTHNSAVTVFQKNAAARKGKSWRDLKKKAPRPKSARNR
jgi:UPF0755 protein